MLLKVKKKSHVKNFYQILYFFLLQFHYNIYEALFLRNDLTHELTEISPCISFQATILFILHFLAE